MRFNIPYKPKEAGMDDILQCPECVLRFTSRSELQQHLMLDHPRRDDDDSGKSHEHPLATSPEPRPRG
ncbi:MAG: hypothetical protein M3346_06475 [Actinomycetota bacterium]|nr:hypothetical protein [Actinomycetota bacterium]